MIIKHSTSIEVVFGTVRTLVALADLVRCSRVDSEISLRFVDAEAVSTDKLFQTHNIRSIIRINGNKRQRGELVIHTVIFTLKISDIGDTGIFITRTRSCNQVHTC